MNEMWARTVRQSLTTIYGRYDAENDTGPDAPVHWSTLELATAIDRLVDALTEDSAETAPLVPENTKKIQSHIVRMLLRRAIDLCSMKELGDVWKVLNPEAVVEVSAEEQLMAVDQDSFDATVNYRPRQLLGVWRE